MIADNSLITLPSWLVAIYLTFRLLVGLLRWLFTSPSIRLALLGLLAVLGYRRACRYVSRDLDEQRWRQ